MKRTYCLPNNHFAASRRGIVLATVILCFLVASAMIINLVRSTTTLSRQTTHQSQRLQLQVLTDDAMSHALHQYQTQEDYTKETWEISPDQWALKQSGHVQIRLIKNGENKTILSVEGSLLQGKQVLQKLTKTMELKPLGTQ
ncbi:MAG: hypothetical protein JKY95_03320 [Planctomycetaceae bacterium]|nr:hypothetical protein [Planctomycetaceae bacterium]